MAHALQPDPEMAHPSTDPHNVLRPMPVVPIGAVQQHQITNRDDDSIRPVVAAPDGAASDARDVGGISGVPWERRPLSRRAILAWTIGAVVSAIALATAVAIALSRSTARTDVPAPSAEPAHLATIPSLSPSAEAPSNVTPAAQEAAPPAASVVPLSALPKVSARPAASRAKKIQKDKRRAPPALRIREKRAQAPM
jgi:hypothetical protein